VEVDVTIRDLITALSIAPDQDVEVEVSRTDRAGIPWRFGVVGVSLTIDSAVIQAAGR